VSVTGHEDLFTQQKSIVYIKIEKEDLGRFGAALWFLVGTRIKLGDFAWVLPILGTHGDRLLFNSLRESGAIDEEGILQPVPTALWLANNAGDKTSIAHLPHLVWTLPSQHPDCSVKGASYRKTLIKIINQTQHELLLISPFLHERGVVTLTESILAALSRGVMVTIITHEIEDIGSDQSRAIEELRREAHRMSLRLDVYTANLDSRHLLHAKFCISDRERLVLGSANISGSGLHNHFEAGVVLGRYQALEAMGVINGLIESGLTKHVIAIHGS